MQKKLFIGLILVVLVAAGLYLYAHHRATQVVDQQVDRLVSSKVYDSLEYESLDLGMTGDVQLNNVQLSKNGDQLVMQEVSITNLDYSHETPWHMDIEIRGLHFPDGLPDVSTLGSPAITTLLNDVVQDDTIPVIVHYGYNYNPNESHQLTYNASTALPEYFTLTMASESRNVPLETMMSLSNGATASEEATLKMMELLSTLAVPQARIALQDQGIVDSWITSTAESSGMNPGDLREQMKSQARNYYLFMPQNAQGIAMQAGIQLAAFLDGGRTLSIAVTPEYEGSISRLQQEVMAAAFTQDFKKIADVLHLQIEAQ